MTKTTAPGLIEQMVNDLFVPESRRLEMEIERLDKANREMKGHERYGFMHAGVVYIPKSSPYLRSPGVSYPTLHFALCKQANAFIKDMQKVENDKQMIKQMCHLLTHTCEHWQDIRDALPDALVELQPWTRDFPRAKEEAYTLRHDERAMRQYTQLLEKIDFYVATRMIY